MFDYSIEKKMFFSSEKAKKILKEFRVEDPNIFKEGNEIGLEIFKEIKFVDVNPKTLNVELNKVELSNNKKSKHKTCINKLNNRLKIQEKNKKIENRVLTGLFLSVVAVLFFVAT